MTVGTGGAAVLAGIIARDLARDLDFGLARVHAHARDLARDLGREIDLEPDDVFARAGGIVDDLNRARALVRHFSLDLAVLHAVNLSYDLTRDIGRARNSVRTHDASVRCFVRAEALADAVERAARMAEAACGTVTSSQQGFRPAPVADRLAQVVTRVLPEMHRRRYVEEFQSELWELAANGAPRWVQLVHTVRLLDRAWVLRAELREGGP